jgi:hypothetical protein
MADIDFKINTEEGFTISLDGVSGGVTGNRALLNRFQIAFMTNIRAFLNVDGGVESDNFGGDAPKFLGTSIAVNNTSVIAASLLNAISTTVASLKSTEDASIPGTERISSASLDSLNVLGDVVSANIRVVPVETQSYSDLIFSLPVRGV